jgi:aminoglycoside phosphotransferase family enzyme/predicted kinase
MTNTLEDQARQQKILIDSLLNPLRYPHGIQEIRTIETHISTVILTGEYAYKIKKPLDLGFLDFSTLERRRHFCEEEVRLNRRLAPGIYLGVVALTGDPSAPQIEGQGEAVEYAVKMRQFPQEGLLDTLLTQGALTPEHANEIARRIADFHGSAALADPESEFGRPESALAPMTQNFEQIRALVTEARALEQLNRLERWTQARFAELEPVLAIRRSDGFTRECHGDMHLGNMALIEGEINVFDGIEFNDNLKWIDTASDVAFLTMDLDDRNANALANRVLNAYLEITGDYQLARVLRFYQVYRALVRAKIATIRLSQAGLSEAEGQQVMAQYRSYADLAEHYTRERPPTLFLMHGVSGCGKTLLSQQLVDQHGAVRVRSDLERKRLFDLAASARSGSAQDAGIYSAEAGQKTYDRLADLSVLLLESGFTAVVDATFLTKAQRQRFRRLAHQQGVALTIVDLQAGREVLRQRVLARERSGTDASEANLEVLERQLQYAEALEPDEADYVVQVHNDGQTPVKLELPAGLAAHEPPEPIGG